MRKRIAILGGGMSSLVTAYELTSIPGWDTMYDITVYTLGWRLGGKGASGRNPDAGQRIEEHGLHILFGFYDNALGLMRDVYQNLGRSPGQPLATFDDAFKGHNFIVMMENYKGAWSPWKLDPIPNPLAPGGDGFLKPWDYIQRLLEWFLEVIHNYLLHTDTVKLAQLRAGIRAAKPELKAKMDGLVLRGLPRPAGPEDRNLDDISAILSKYGVDMKPFLVHPTTVPAGAAHPLWWLYLELAVFAYDAAAANSKSIAFLLDQAAGHLWLHPWESITWLRRLRMLLDLMFAIVRGLIASGVILPPFDWFSIDNYDLSDFLAKYGANADTLASPLVSAMYDAAYHGYVKIGAGTILQAMLRMLLTYRGNILYKMQAGMGETIFVPFYQVLSQRGVKFEFFKYVRNLGLSADKKRVERIDMGVQATLKTGVYQPLVTVKDLPCWPSAPLFDQLVQGDAIRMGGYDLEDWWTAWPDVDQFTLHEGADYDEVVLGVSIGSFPYIAPELSAASASFAKMVDTVKTTQTQGISLWLKPDLEGLGWDLTSPVVIPYVEPLDTWSDMTYLLAREDWPAGSDINNLAYLTGPMEDDGPLPPRSQHGYAQKQNDRCKQFGIDWLQSDVKPLWPKAATPSGEIDWQLLNAPNSVIGVKRMDYQYWRAPLSPSERYVLSVPDSNAARLRPEQSGFDNVVLTGDYTKTALSVGCLEAASMAGIMAARAINPSVPKAKWDWLPDLPHKLPTPSAMTRPFIQIDGQLLAIPPIQTDTTLYMFALAADYKKLTAICNQQLNLGADAGNKTVYKPLLPFVTLYCSRLVSTPLGNPIGYVPELDYGIWVPLVAGTQEGSVFHPERLVSYSPYIYVDTGLALIGGRTIYGYLKETANLLFPSSPSTANRFTVDTQVLPKFGPDQEVQVLRLIDVHHQCLSLIDEAKALWQSAKGGLDFFGSAVDSVLSGHVGLPSGGPPNLKSLLDSLSLGMRMVFLKQFPSASDATKACYQAIVEGDITITGDLKAGWLPGPYAVDIYKYQSHQIVKTLGLATVHGDDKKDTVLPIVQGWATFKSLVQPGQVIWEAKLS